jgi:hypothetical protein
VHSTKDAHRSNPRQPRGYWPPKEHHTRVCPLSFERQRPDLHHIMDPVTDTSSPSAIRRPRPGTHRSNRFDRPYRAGNYEADCPPAGSGTVLATTRADAPEARRGEAKSAAQSIWLGGIRAGTVHSRRG